MQWLDAHSLAIRLQYLDPVRFLELCNQLLVDVTVRAGIDPSHLALNLRVHDADGGIDARCEESPSTVGRIIV